MKKSFFWANILAEIQIQFVSQIQARTSLNPKKMYFLLQREKIGFDTAENGPSKVSQLFISEKGGLDRSFIISELNPKLPTSEQLVFSISSGDPCKYNIVFCTLPREARRKVFTSIGKYKLF